MKKHILFVEDFPDEHNNEDAIACKIKKWFGERYCNEVELYKQVYPKRTGNLQKKDEKKENLLLYIDEDLKFIDCVVLDVNLEKGIPSGKTVFNSMVEHFKSGGVTVAEDINEVVRKGGLYIYLYLLLKGFPHDRIIVHTAYDSDVEGWQKSFSEAGLVFPDYIVKNEDEDKENACEEKINEKKLYTGDNEYYVIRNIVFTAIDYWKNKLASDDNILFNKKVDDSKKVSRDKINEMFNKIEMYLPIIKPSKCEGAYNSILKVLAEPFEAVKRRINYDDESDIYVKIIKMLRNWYAHSKFSTYDIKKTEFILLFLIAFRAYFGKDDDIAEYEKVAFEFVKNSYTKDVVSDKKHINEFERTHHIISKTWEKRTVYLEQLEYLEQKKGRENQNICTYTDLLEGLWSWKYSFEYSCSGCNKTNSNNNYEIILQPSPKKTSKFGDSVIDVIKYMID